MIQSWPRELGADLANYKDAPLAEAATKFLGNIGRTILLAGATISGIGFVTSDISFAAHDLRLRNS